MNTQYVTFAFISQIPDAVFHKLQEAGVVAGNLSAVAEYQQFSQKFLAAYQKRDPVTPPQIPAWRQFSSYGNGYFLHPYASEIAFPPKKRLLGSLRIAAQECCDAKLDQSGTITTVNISPIAAIYADGTILVIQGICDDPAVTNNPSISGSARNPFTLNIKNPNELGPFFKRARQEAGNNLLRLLQRPPYFPTARR